ncbi:Hypothetical predicted protein [Mytilus galloprovincialis]|uniref:EGF-like domain-containing protein n=1 Tax=Mytilus galloprovincialis TaxID=29158 RepID=A0A8B6HNT3_MYTGA|nr:Hypothetical predicted protein [Mytilus galloprovincialis]
MMRILGVFENVSKVVWKVLNKRCNMNIISMDIILIFVFAVICAGLVEGTCPSTCSCVDNSSGSHVNCNSKYLGRIPTLPNDTYHLNLHNNNISTIKAFAFMNLPSLRNLNLNNNKLRSLVSYTFINLTNLNALHLYGNNISHIEEHAFGKLTSLTLLDLSGNPLNCDCSIFAFWSWLIERSSIHIRSYAKCSNGTLVTSLQSDELETCNPDNCQCFNGGKCVAKGHELICDCIGKWTGIFCQESQCTSYDCGFGDCYIEPVNGTAQCLCDDIYVNFCPGKLCNFYYKVM